MKEIQYLKCVVKTAEFGEWTSNKLASVRFARESDEETLKRVIKQALKTICPDCRGHKHSLFYNTECRGCYGTGERIYDPFSPIIEEIIET